MGPSEPVDDGLHALHRAARAGDEDLFRLLAAGQPIDRRAGPPACDKVVSYAGCTALHLAAEAGHGAVCARLVARGAEVDARNERLETPLFLAAARGHREVVGTLVGEGADPNAVDAFGKTPLHGASGYGDMPTLVLLLRRGAVPCLDRSRMSPLHLAAMQGHLAVVQRLVSAGTPVGAVDSVGRTAEAWARAQGHDHVADWLA